MIGEVDLFAYSLHRRHGKYMGEVATFFFFFLICASGPQNWVNFDTGVGIAFHVCLSHFVYLPNPIPRALTEI